MRPRSLQFLTFSGLLCLVVVQTLGQEAPEPDASAPSEVQQDASSPQVSPSQAQAADEPASAPSAETPNLLGSAATFTAIQPFLNGTTLEPQMLQNLTYRFIGADLYTVTNNFREVAQQIADDLTIGHFSYNEVIYRPGVRAPVYGPDGLNGTREAYAPTPGQVAPNFGNRKMLAEFTPQTIADRMTALMAIDVEIRLFGAANSSLVRINQPSSFNGYMMVQMAQAGVDLVLVVPLNTSTTYNIINITNQMPLTNYVLGTVIRFKGSGFFPANTQGQNMLLATLVQIMGSQGKFLYNRVQQGVQDEAEGLMTLAIITYTNTNVSTMDEVAGGNVQNLMDQIAASAGVNFTALVLQSRHLGTQAEEITGNPKFMMDPYAVSANLVDPTRKGDEGGGLSGGAIAGIVVGAVVAAALVALLLGFFVWRKRQARKTRDLEEGMKEEQGVLRSLKSPIMNSQDTSPSNSKASEKKTSASSTPTSQKHNFAFAALNESWVIKREELAVRQLPNGKDWLLGSGSFGAVFRGLRGGIQDVAIKQMNKPGSVELKMFEKEVALLRHLNHDRNLVQFYGACIADDNLMLVLEYMDGGDLKDAISNDSEGFLVWQKKGASILCDIARGLHFLHSNRVAHRDLKSKNVLLSKSGEAKIADVGLAKLVGSQLMSTQLNVAGTFAYAAPELLLNEPCDTRADIYSLGVIIWEVVTRETPVRGAMRRIEVPKEAPQEIADLIAACLARDSAARPTAKEAFESLQAIAGVPQSKWTVGLPPVTEESNPLTTASTQAPLVSTETSNGNPLSSDSTHAHPLTSVDANAQPITRDSVDANAQPFTRSSSEQPFTRTSSDTQPVTSENGYGNLSSSNSLTPQAPSQTSFMTSDFFSPPSTVPGIDSEETQPFGSETMVVNDEGQSSRGQSGDSTSP